MHYCTLDFNYETGQLGSTILQFQAFFIVTLCDLYIVTPNETHWQEVAITKVIRNTLLSWRLVYKPELLLFRQKNLWFQLRFVNIYPAAILPTQSTFILRPFLKGRGASRKNRTWREKRALDYKFIETRKESHKQSSYLTINRCFSFCAQWRSSLGGVSFRSVRGV